MNYSDIKSSAYEYLSYRNVEKSDELDKKLERYIEQIISLDTFKAVYAEYDALPQFEEKEPYKSFLKGAQGIYLIVCTLGSEIDRQIKRRALSDMPEMILFDACANSILEYKSEEFKNGISSDLSYLFCPGYQGSELSDIKMIFELLKPEKIGVTLTDSFMMVPQKTLAGIAAKGVNPQKKCGNCARLNNCVYRKVGKLCYN